MEGYSILAASPNFCSYSSTRFADLADRVTHEFPRQREELGLESFQDFDPFQEFEPFLEFKSFQEFEPFQEFDEEQTHISAGASLDEPKQDDQPQEQKNESEFEFPVLSQDSSVYPVFNRDLLFSGREDDFEKLKNSAASIMVPVDNTCIDERHRLWTSVSSSEADELEEIAPHTFCVWSPGRFQTSPTRCTKSNSTGSSKGWKKFRNLLSRSNSDGKDAYVFLKSTDSKESSKTKPESLNQKLKSSVASAHEVHYLRNRASRESERHQSYLPYRKDLVTCFALTP